jgi:hypothetical protein
MECRGGAGQAVRLDHTPKRQDVTPSARESSRVCPEIRTAPRCEQLPTVMEGAPPRVVSQIPCGT